MKAEPKPAEVHCQSIEPYVDVMVVMSEMCNRLDVRNVQNRRRGIDVWAPQERLCRCGQGCDSVSVADVLDAGRGPGVSCLVRRRPDRVERRARDCMLGTSSPPHAAQPRATARSRRRHEDQRARPRSSPTDCASDHDWRAISQTLFAGRPEGHDLADSRRG